MRRKSKKALSILLLICWIMLLFYWIRDYYGVYPRPEDFTPEGRQRVQLWYERRKAVQRLRRYYGENYKYVDGVRRTDDFNFEEYYATIYIYQLTPELEAQIRQEVKLGPHVRLRSIDEYFWED